MSALVFDGRVIPNRKESDDGESDKQSNDDHQDQCRRLFAVFIIFTEIRCDSLFLFFGVMGFWFILDDGAPKFGLFLFLFGRHDERSKIFNFCLS